MIEVIPFAKIDKEKWDTCIHTSINGNIYGLYDSICLACDNWIGLVYGNYEAVLALPLKKKLGLTYSWHPQFMGPLGVYSSRENKEVVIELFLELTKHSWWIKMHYWQNVTTSGFDVSEKVFQELDMHGANIDNIRSGYNENTKRNFKKAIKQNLIIKSITDVDKVIQTFKENKGDQIENINEDSYSLLKKLMTHWLKNKLGYISAVYDGDRLAAIGYFLVWNGTVIYYKGAVTELGRSTGAMHFLIDHEIERNLGVCKYFDFGGSNTASVAQFYKGFGGLDKNYFLYEYKKFKI